MNLIFPDVFETGQLGKEIDEKKLCADALCGWANCMAGAKPPKMFGQGMSVIGQKLGITPTAKNIEKYVIDKGWLSA